MHTKEVEAAIKELRHVASIVENTQPVWAANLRAVCDALDHYEERLFDAYGLII